MDKEFLEIVGNGKPTGSVQKGDNCSFRHDANERAKSTQPNPSPRFFSWSRVREMRREPEVPEEEVPSGRMSRLALQGLPQRNLHQFIL